MTKEQKFLMKLGRRVRKLRKSKGYSQDRLYLEAGFSRGTMSKIEAGSVNVKIGTLLKIAETIGVSLWTLVDVRE